MVNEIDLHGGNIYKEAEKHGMAPYEILDFSANINPLGIPQGLKEHLINCLDKCINYPDPDSTMLKTQLSKYLGLDKANICVGNGAVDIIYLLFKSLKIKRLLVPAPCFVEYERAASFHDIDIVFFERQEKDGFRIDFSEFLHVLKEEKPDAILLCNPNNPTSTLESSEDIINLAEKCLEKGINVIVDEAFIELTKRPDEYSVVSYVQKYSNLFVIRAFTKSFAIPGIRLGYCLASRENTAKLIEIQPSWPVNTLASEAGKVFETDKEYIKATSEWINTELDYLYDELSKINELKAYPPNTNFILCRILSEGWDSEWLKEALIMKGILIRNAGNFKYLDNNYFRVAVKDREKNNLLINALKEIDWR